MNAALHVCFSDGRTCVAWHWYNSDTVSTCTKKHLKEICMIPKAIVKRCQQNSHKLFGVNMIAFWVTAIVQVPIAGVPASPLHKYRAHWRMSFRSYSNKQDVDISLYRIYSRNLLRYRQAKWRKNDVEYVTSVVARTSFAWDVASTAKHTGWCHQWKNQTRNTRTWRLLLSSFLSRAVVTSCLPPSCFWDFDLGACYFWVYTATIHAYLDTDPGWAVSVNKGIKDLVRDAHGSSVLCNRRAGDMRSLQQVFEESRLSL